MSRSVSAPSSVTYTSPCWNGLIVPGSTLRYGSNFWSWTRRPRALSSRPSDAATMPFPSAETTPPVTKTYFGARALTGFQGSSGGGRRGSRWLRARLHEVVEAARARCRGKERRTVPQPASTTRTTRVRAASTCSSSSSAAIRSLTSWKAMRRPRTTSVTSSVPAAPGRLNMLGQNDEDARRQDIRRPDRPARSGGEPTPVRLDAADVRPPVGEVVRLGEEGPDVLDRREQDAVSCVPWQGTPGRRASARARRAARRRRAARSACAWDRPGSSRRGSGGRRAPRSAAGA